MPYDIRYKGTFFLNKDEIIDKLVLLPDLPILFISRYGAWGRVTDIDVIKVRKCADGTISIISQPALAEFHFNNNPKAYKNWLDGENVEVIAITG